MDGLTILLVLVISIAIMIYLSGKVKVNAFLVLLAVAFLMGLASGLGLVKTVQTIADGFSATLRFIGIVFYSSTYIDFKSYKEHTIHKLAGL